MDFNWTQTLAQGRQNFRSFLRSAFGECPSPEPHSAERPGGAHAARGGGQASEPVRSSKGRPVP
eukprot:14464206-Alexandrium_andersonii.AAC.1